MHRVLAFAAAVAGEHLDADTTVTNSTSVGFSRATPSQVLIAPARTEQLFCEATVTTDSKGLIARVQATQDTRSAGLSGSRCAEVFGVEK